MKFFIVGLLLFPLIAVINCQTTAGGDGGIADIPEPTPEQLQCITEASTPRLQEIMNDCGDLLMVNDVVIKL